MRKFQEFLDKKVVVSFSDKNEQLEFMKLCERNGLLWQSGLKPTEYNCCVISVVRHADDRLVCGVITLYKRDGFEVVPASEFLHQPPTIEIFQSKRTVVCLKKQDGKVVAVGKAKCSPEDVFDFEFGATLAFQRMIGMKPEVEVRGVKTLKNGIKIRKQDKYEIGDRVLIKKKSRFSLGKEYRGKIVTIKERKKHDATGDEGYGIDEDNGFFIWYDEEIKGKVIE